MSGLQHKRNDSIRARTSPHFSYHLTTKELGLDPVPIHPAQNPGLGLPQEDSLLAATTQGACTRAPGAPQGATWGAAVRKAGTACSGPNPRGQRVSGQWQGPKTMPTRGQATWILGGILRGIYIWAGLAKPATGSPPSCDPGAIRNGGD